MSSDVFKAIADTTRRDIIAALHRKPMAVHELAAQFAISRPAVSKHLALLTDARLVRATRSGKENVYELQQEALSDVADWVARYWFGRLQTLKQLAERKQ